MTVGRRAQARAFLTWMSTFAAECLALSVAITLFFVTDFVLTRPGVFTAIPSDPV
jgi:hypothetical protein